MNKSNEFYTYLQSQQTAQRYLLQCYKKIGTKDAESKSYANCNTFIYYLDHGNRFFESGKQLDLFARPILYFYGLTHLLKACLLTKRPDYPESTTYLAHGVTARKRKKKNYSFMEDEVKVQHHGLLPYFSEHLLSMKKLPFEKIKMGELLALIPEMDSYFTYGKQAKMVTIGSCHSPHLQFPMHLLDTYHLTENAFIHRVQAYLPCIKQIKHDKSTIHVELNSLLRQSAGGPFFFHMEDETIYFPIHRESYCPISEIIIHYLLLYNLSMLSRYEAEWWGELLQLKPDQDYPFITHFLQITAKKMPMMLEQALYTN
ncbi:hypothetical protein CV093_00045 [Oceanobacillus sp. 143]|uniref:YaaC n=1 Tax=Oceanobacillus zhaokaii TaxID=2052660 RepID=A0A345PBW9_9BACI|nr:YaaC family protein [Oceanobacillus zhaokaii]AXI07499.1 hypothetical protein CUC15_00045 [Oceanobacillus zhaokaii]QGS67741.1 hypothetical protein CV093_00045 [Oceanobacillus sp. 143]